MQVNVELPDKESCSLREVVTALDKNISTCWRWVLHGVRGHKLPTFFVGGRASIHKGKNRCKSEYC